ncbi:NUDIX hydrolase domain-like protein [Naematelia encephala]|uniref:NUDIX hydrolase domain-like protein n=1 Tax=Naematelia encephala TaxID=71784 RepID=A0A1Y2BC08_9TREE|nr:NUDIX hydrolase domain-like protein [Naematelia encephala]
MAHSKPTRHVAVAIVFSGDTRRILMITSRKHHHLWILPKGGIEQGETSGQAAIRESWEEAGTPNNLPIPNDDQRLITLHLEAAPHQKRSSVWHVHVIHVSEALVDVVTDWPERHERRREWVDIEEALRRIQAWYTDQKASEELEGEAVEDGQGTTSRIQDKKEKKGGAMETALRRFIEMESKERTS